MKIALSCIAGLAAFAAAAASPLDAVRGWKKMIVEESVDIEAFEHGDFEGSKAGTYLKYGEIGRYGVNGGGGLRIRPKSKAQSFVFPLKGRLEKGKRYIFSADVRTQGKTKGEVAMDAKFAKTGKYAHGCGAWGANVENLADGWTHQRVEVVAKHAPEDMRYSFMIYCRVSDPADEFEYIDVDNVRIEVAAPKWYLCNTWPMHNLLYADTGRIRFNSSFYGDFFAPGAKPFYGCSLADSAGNVLGETLARADKNGNFTLDFGALNYKGAAKLTVALYDRAARLNRGAREFDVTVCVPDRNKGLYVKENGVVLKDGRPFMPLGFYTNIADPQKYDMKAVEYHLRRLSQAGFNAIMDYQTYSLRGKRRDEFYRLCSKYGIWVLADDFKVGVKGKGFQEQLDKVYRPLAKKLAEYPAIIGFYTMDESSEDCVPNLALLRRMLNEVAPGRIVNICNIMRTAPFLPTADIQGGDSYPVKKNHGCSLRDPYDRVSKLAACDPGAIWYAPQCYNWARMTKGAKDDPELYRRSGREPTMEEMLSVALCMVADRTNGFFFYAYFDLLECPIPEWREERWKSMCAIAKKMLDLEPFIMSGEKITTIPCKDSKGTVRASVLSDGRGNRRIIVTGLDLEHDSTFTLPAGCENLRPTMGRVEVSGGVCRFRGGAFSCDILK